MTESRNTNGPESVTSDIVRAAYSTSVLPQEFRAFNAAVSRLLDANPAQPDGQDSETLDAWIAEQVASVQSHVAHALDLSERREPSTPAAPGARRLVLEDPRPSALLTLDGRLSLVNAPAQACGLAAGKPIRKHLADKESRKRFDAFIDDARGTPLPLVTVALDVSQSRYTIARVLGEDGAVVLRLTALRAAYEETIGDRMAADFGLTPSELIVLAALVEGTKLGELAEASGKAVGTLRNQLKSCFAKTQVSSQADLVALYGIYARQHVGRYSGYATPSASQSPLIQKTTITLRDGRKMRCTFAGPSSGRPVLYLNALMTGHEITSPMLKALVAKGLRLVMPWRPGWEWSDPYPDMSSLSALAYVERVVDDLVDVADQLKMDRFPCLASNAGTIFAFALAKRFPDRVMSLTAPAPLIPLRHAADIRQRGKQQQPYLLFSRFAPSLVRAYCRFAIAKMDAGFDEEHAENLYRDEPPDLALSQTAQGKMHLRRAMSDVRLQGVDALCLDIILRASKWAELAEGATLPVHLICGKHDTSLVPSQVERFSSGMSRASIEWLEDCGNLVLLQRPERVVEALAEQVSSVS